MRFLCDQMLGTLAKWLRLLGFDVYFANRVERDDELLEIAKKENRIILSRDKQLVKRARKRGIEAIDVEDRDLDEQLRKVTSLFPIDEESVLSRCSVCNEILVEIDKKDVEGKIPKKIFESHEEFWYCKRCKKIYWKGSHWDKISEKIDKLKNANRAS
ncbi:MAG TPA: hypothetical protein ENG74_00490 [Thermoplasmatales archaeon]|nr:hypothetical protein [Thermoplasmatales archaeon]